MQVQEDDLRQDAIMNQVFSYVNGLMMRRGDGFASKVSSSCFQKGLKMVTYNVSPLSPMSGVSDTFLHLREYVLIASYRALATLKLRF